MSVQSKKLPIIGVTLEELVIICVLVLAFEVGKDMAEGVPAPGNLTTWSFFWAVVRMLIIGAVLNRLVYRHRTDTQSKFNRCKIFSFLSLLVTLFFSWHIWSNTDRLVESGLSLLQALQQSSLWLVFGVAAVGCSMVCAYMAWFHSDDSEVRAALDGSRIKDERELELAKRTAQSALTISIVILAFAVPIIELAVLRRYPVMSFSVAGLIGLSWLGSHAYWSTRM